MNRKALRLLSGTLLLFALSASPSSARIWRVPSDAPTIQAGIDLAAPYDTVMVDEGTYHEAYLTLILGLTLMSETGNADCVMIDGQGRNSVIFCGFVSDVTIKGFTIIGGNELNAGGIYVKYCDQVAIRNCVFHDNSGPSGGGGIGVIGSSVLVENCTVVGNESNIGGAGIGVALSTLDLVNTIVAFNTGLSVWVFTSDLTFTCTDIYGNTGGDWINPFPGWLYLNNNRWADPLFCDAEAGNFFVSSYSPCAPGGSSCFQGIGALGIACDHRPITHFDPGGFDITMNSGSYLDTLLTISNVGDFDLTWRISEETGGPLKGAQGASGSRWEVRGFGNDETVAEAGREFENLSDAVMAVGSIGDDENAALGSSATKRTGGPDAFGHRWIDSDEPGGPVFDWRDISGVGTALSLGDNDYASVALPFAFPFYGIIQSEVKISSNGYLTFGIDGTDSSNDPIPSSNQPNDFIAPFWDDLDPPAGGSIHYFHDAVEQLFFVQYTDIQRQGGSGQYTFQVRMQPNGTILYQYLNMQGELTDATIGIENASATMGLQVVHDAPYVHDELAVLIQDECPWLTRLEPLQGAVLPNGSQDVHVGIQSSGLAPGSYECQLLVGSNDPLAPETAIPVMLTVIGDDVVSLSVLMDAEAGTIEDQDNLAATEVGATDGYDPGLDIPDPPAPPTNYVSTYFPHPGWPLGDRYHADVRSPFDPLTELKVWPFTVESDQSGTMTLTFEPSFTAADDINLTLHDLVTGSVHDLFPTLTFSYALNGPGGRSFELLIGTHLVSPPLQPVERNITAGWSLIGFPLLPEPPGILQDVLLDDVTGRSYLYRYLGEPGYEMADSGDPAVQGEGLWLAVDQPFTWTMEGNKDLDGALVPLHNGWTLIGYPMWFPGDVAGVQVEFESALYDWWNAVSAGIVSGVVYDYDASLGDYVATESLETWHGYWIAGLQDGVVLRFDYPNFLAGASAASRPDDGGAPAHQRWRITVKGNDGHGKQDEVTFGVSPLATAGFDAAWDFPAPPRTPAGERAFFYFSRPGWGLQTGNRFSSDIVAPTTEPLVWTAHLEGTTPGTITLSWESADWPAGLDLQVYLPAQNRVVVTSMRDQQSVTLEIMEAPSPIQFRMPVAMTRITDIPQAMYDLRIHPNPFNPTCEISFNMPTGGDVAVSIYDLQGKLVRQLAAGALPAGNHHVIWYGKDDSGRDAASGVFFASLYIDGQRVGQIEKMSLIR